ncbi:MAG TPA: arginase family protein, partial [Polyangiales bacterium]|nr:arginase family protein [Polyangiales bacterium]
LDEGLLRANDVIQVGIRGPFSSGLDLHLARGRGVQIVMIDQIKENLRAVGDLIAQTSARGKCYVSFDMDGVDPAYAPGTGTPVPGGMTSYEALALVRRITGSSVVGGDIVEISPDHDPSGNTALLAATVLAEMIATIAQSRPAP